MKTVKKENINVSASVSCMNLCNLKKDMQEVEKSRVSFYHFDVVDGRFNNCFMLGEPTLKSMREEASIPIEVHLAVYEPEKFIEACAKLGADYIAVHYESLKDPYKIFKMIRDFGAKPVLAYKSNTAPENDFPSLAEQVSWILKLTVEPGFSGQKIQRQAVEHIASMRCMLDEAGLNTGIEADGNINIYTIPQVVKAGADILTGGSSGLFVENCSVEQSCNEMVEIAARCQKSGNRKK